METDDFDYQGKRPDQVNGSLKIVGLTLAVASIILIVFLFIL